MTNGRFRIMLAHHRGPYKASFAIAVTMLLALFVFFPPFEFKPYTLQAVDTTIVVNVIPEVKIPPPPRRDPLPPRTVVPYDGPEPDEEFPMNAIDDILKVRPPTIDTSPKPFVPFDQLPVPEFVVRPRYPQMAREAGLEGTVHLKVLIGLDHKVHQAVVISSDVTPEMDQAAIEAALKCRYRPAKQQGVEVEVWCSIRIEFRLN